MISYAQLARVTVYSAGIHIALNPPLRGGLCRKTASLALPSNNQANNGKGSVARNLAQRGRRRGWAADGHATARLDAAEQTMQHDAVRKNVDWLAVGPLAMHLPGPICVHSWAKFRTDAMVAG